MGFPGGKHTIKPRPGQGAGFSADFREWIVKIPFKDLLYGKNVV